MKIVRVCVPLLAVACGAVEQPAGQIQVIAQAQTASGQIARVVVASTLAPAPIELTRDPTNPDRFTGNLSLPVGAQRLTADAFDASSRHVGAGTADVTVTKRAQLTAQITILDGTGAAPGPDHSPVVTSLVTPVSAMVGDAPTLTGAAMDADGDTLGYSWSALPLGCGTFASPTATSTTFTAQLLGTCAVTFTATAGGKSASKSADIRIDPATGNVDVTVDYVPQPVIGSISFSSNGSTIVTVTRDGPDATIRAAFHKGTPYTVTVSFDPWPTGTIALADTCSGTIQPPGFVPNSPTATATWTPTVNSGVCILTATLSRNGLSDSLFVVVLPVP
jgi:hypothetical protein